MLLKPYFCFAQDVLCPLQQYYSICAIKQGVKDSTPKECTDTFDYTLFYKDIVPMEQEFAVRSNLHHSDTDRNR